MKIALALMLSLLWATSCGKSPTGGPPKILYGQDICSHCGMIVSEERFAAAITDKSLEHALFFDDVGCMIDFDRKHHSATATRYFHDFSTHEWLTGEEAVFVHAKDVQTPMASGLLAFRTADDARKTLKNSSIEARSYTALLQASKAENREPASVSTR